MHQSPNPLIGRFSKKSKPLLVDYINRINNRALVPEQLEFGVPLLINDSGLSQVEISFSSTTGWDTAKRVLTYNRVDLNMILHNAPIVVHVPDYTPESLYKAILEQYGVLIEPELVDLTLVTASLNDAIFTPNLLGFQAADSAVSVEVPIEPPYLDNRNYSLTFKDKHLIFFGSVQVMTRRSLDLLGTTIDSLMDLRAFYADGNFDRPPVDLYLPNSELKVSELELLTTERRMYESQLYSILPQTTIQVGTPLVPLLRQLTGDQWISADVSDQPFNVFGAEVLYNGFVNKDYSATDPAYNYLLALKLGNACTNLSGIIKIAYRYSDSKTPGNLPYDRASVPPIFSN